MSVCVVSVCVCVCAGARQLRTIVVQCGSCRTVVQCRAMTEEVGYGFAKQYYLPTSRIENLNEVQDINSNKY